MPILLHPLPRHLMPAGVAIVLLVALHGRLPIPALRSAKFRVMLGRTLTLLLLPVIVLGLARERSLSQKQFDVATSLSKRGVPVTQIDAGWAFFCARDLKPGLPAAAYLPPNDYVSRFTRVQQRAPFIVSTDKSAPGQKLAEYSVVLPPGQVSTVRTLRRTQISRPSRPLQAPARSRSNISPR
jgi:hypothetical protein